MKRSTTLLLPLLLLVLASCGTPAQYSQQRFQDGIYAAPGEEPKVVQLYTEEDFEAMAAANIARKQQGTRDTLVVVLDDPWGYSWRYPYSSWAWGGLGFGSYYWHRWRFGGWYDPWFYDPWYGGWGYGWYDPWFDPWYGPYYGGYYPGYYGYGWNYGWYDPWYGPYYGGYGHWYPGGWGGHSRIHGNYVYTPRSLTEPVGRRETRPGSGRNYRYGTPGSAGSTAIGTRSGSNTVRRSQSGVRTGTSGSTTTGSAAQRREQGYNPNRSYNNRDQQSSSQSRTQTRSYNSNSNSGNYNSGASRSTGGGYSSGGGGGYSSGGGSFGGGGSSSHSGGGGGGSRGGGGRR